MDADGSPGVAASIFYHGDTEARRIRGSAGDVFDLEPQMNADERRWISGGEGFDLLPRRTRGTRRMRGAAGDGFDIEPQMTQMTRMSFRRWRLRPERRRMVLSAFIGVIGGFPRRKAFICAICVICGLTSEKGISSAFIGRIGDSLHAVLLRSIRFFIRRKGSS
jgi:hypothetical protein